jgi:hypothetical protein
MRRLWRLKKLHESSHRVLLRSKEHPHACTRVYVFCETNVLKLAPHFELETLVRNSAAFTLVAQPVQRLR